MHTIHQGPLRNISLLAFRSNGAIGIELAFALLINVIALLGNVLVCIAIYKNSRLRSITGYFILSLAVSDVLMATLCMPLSAGASLEGKWIYGDQACQTQGYLINTLAAVSLHTMSLTAIHRYFCVVRPNSCRKLFTKKRTILVITCVWVIVFLVPALEMASGLISFVFHEGKVICIIDRRANFKWLPHLSTFIVINIILPMTIMFICYSKVFMRVRKHKVDVNASFHSNNITMSKSKTSLTTTKTKSLMQKKTHAASCTWTNREAEKEIFVQDLTNKLENPSKRQKEPRELQFTTIEINYQQHRKKSEKYETDCDPNSPSCSSSGWSSPQMDHLDMYAHLNQHRCSVVSHRSLSLTTTMPSRGTGDTDSIAPRMFQHRNSIAVVTQRKTSVVLWLNQHRDLLSTKHLKNRVEEAASNLQLKANIEDIKITSVLFVVMLGFMFCWFPILVINLYAVASQNKPLPREVYLLYTYLGAASSAMNPCIYGLMNRSFRSEYIKIIRCKRN